MKLTIDQGEYFDCHVMIELFSSYIVGAHLHSSESGQLAVEMTKEIFGTCGALHVEHGEWGTSMTRQMVAALLWDLFARAWSDRQPIPRLE